MIKYIFLILSLLFSALAQDKFIYHKNHILCKLYKDTGPLPPNLKPVPSRTLSNNILIQSRSATDSSGIFEIEYMTAGETSPVYSNVDCLEFPQNAKSALQRAARIWSSYISSSMSIKVKVCWSSVSLGNLLAVTATQFYYSTIPILEENIIYPTPLYNALIAEDYPAYVSNDVGISILFNSNPSSWYFGIDANPSFNQSDFLSTALHELGHGLGFSGGVSYNGASSNYSTPNIYDTFVENVSGIKATSLSSSQLGTAITSNNLYFSGENANLSNNNQRVKLYAPSTWQSGSSYTHLDDSTYENGTNRLMTTTLMQGDAIHDPGSVSVGILRDMGWSVPHVTQIDTILDSTISTCYPFYLTAKTTSDLSNISWSLTGAPDGMTINSSTGRIYWQKPVSGTYDISIKATYVTGDYDSKDFSLIVEEGECNQNTLSPVLIYLLN